MPAEQYEYDVCLSFAGEQRAYVEEVAKLLFDEGIRVFYDRYEDATLWGKDLYTHLDVIYRKKAKYCILFISAEYARKVWTNHERESAQARALYESREYVLPARFDDTEIPGLRPTIGYIDLQKTPPRNLVELACRKISYLDHHTEPADTHVHKLSGVPTTVEEQRLLIDTKPEGWEYLLFGGVLAQGKQALQEKRRDHQLRYSRSVRAISDDLTAANHLFDAMSAAGRRLASDVMKILDPAAQVWAFGEPGQPGDVDNIIHLAERLIRSYEDLLDWCADIRGTSTSSELESIYELGAQYMDAPIRQMEEFIDRCAESLENLPERLAVGGPIEITLILEPSIDQRVISAFQKEQRRVFRMLRKRK